MLPRRVVQIALLVVLALTAAPLVPRVFAGAPADAKINEIRIDQPGTDNDEYFELKGTPTGSLDSLTYIVVGDGINADVGVIESVTSLAGQVVPADGHFLVGESTMTIASPDLVTLLNFENDDNVTHMLVSGFSGTLAQDLDTNDDGVFDITPWTAVADSVGVLVTGLDPVYSTTTVGPAPLSQEGHYQVCNATWGVAGATVPGDDTPGTDNLCVPPVTTIDSGPGGGTSRGKAVFKFQSDTVGSTFECLLYKTADPSKEFQPKDNICAPDKTVYTKLKNGKYTFDVTATNAATTVEGNTATKTFKVRRR